jgi:ribose 5-phosphate isomerase B
MKIAVGSDHRGFEAKARLHELLKRLGHEVADCGCIDDASCDYPDFAINASEEVAKGACDRAILICGSGIGMSMTANKVCGVRAALCHDELTAEMSRRHNDANVLSLPADLVGGTLINRIVDVWLKTPFEGGRHQRRVKKIMDYEQQRKRCD